MPIITERTKSAQGIITPNTTKIVASKVPMIEAKKQSDAKANDHQQKKRRNKAAKTTTTTAAAAAASTSSPTAMPMASCSITSTTTPTTSSIMTTDSLTSHTFCRGKFGNNQIRLEK
jgi:hypothetical protein